jgi:hypothetical protein
VTIDSANIDSCPHQNGVSHWAASEARIIVRAEIFGDCGDAFEQFRAASDWPQDSKHQPMHLGFDRT